MALSEEGGGIIEAGSIAYSLAKHRGSDVLPALLRG
jgi:hypothetical protein